MPVRSVTSDSEELTISLVADYDVPIDQVWALWSDPRMLERWWGPPEFPATFDRYEFTAHGECRYHMTGSDGSVARGWWRICVIDEPHRLEFEDGFADDNGDPAPGLDSTHVRVTLEAREFGTQMHVLSTFSSVEQLEHYLAMGVVDGLTAAFAQIDPLLSP